MSASDTCSILLTSLTEGQFLVGNDGVVSSDTAGESPRATPDGAPDTLPVESNKPLALLPLPLTLLSAMVNQSLCFTRQIMHALRCRTLPTSSFLQNIAVSRRISTRIVCTKRGHHHHKLIKCAFDSCCCCTYQIVASSSLNESWKAALHITAWH